MKNKKQQRPQNTNKGLFKLHDNPKTSRRYFVSRDQVMQLTSIYFFKVLSLTGYHTPVQTVRTKVLEMEFIIFLNNGHKHWTIREFPL